jgi:hypothetical protein
MPTKAQLAMARPNVNDARCEALFAAVLQPSDVPTAEMVGCASSPRRHDGHSAPKRGEARDERDV